MPLHIEKKQIFTNANMSTNIASIGMPVEQMQLASIQAEWSTGAADGAFSLQISSDDVALAQGADPAANVVNWSDYSGSSTVASGDGNFLWNLNLVGYKWIRLIYTNASGAGVVNAQFVGKG